MRNPRDFFKPLAIGAPEPVTEVPFKPSRMIHFFDASNEKMAAKVPDMAKQADILLGNLEDAVSVDNKVAAREGLVKVAKEIDFGDTALWTRVNDLASPWVLDDLTTLVTEIGDKLDVIMVPKVEGAWDIHYVDRLLAQLEAKAKLERPILVHAILETAQGVVNLEEIATREPADAGDELRPRRPRRLAADEDDPRRRRPPRLPGDQRPRSRRSRGAAGDRAAGPVALLDRAHGRRLHLGRDPALLRALRRHQGRRRAARRSSAPPSCSAASAPGRCTRSQIEIAKKVFSPIRDEVKFAKKVIEAIPDGRGVHMIDGKMQDDATWKQCKVMVELAEMLAKKDPELARGVRALGRDGREFRHTIRVRYNECDPQGHVFNANYLAYFDLAMTELWRELGGYDGDDRGRASTWSSPRPGPLPARSLRLRRRGRPGRARRSRSATPR